jgi:hypothetical protein
VSTVLAIGVGVDEDLIIVVAVSEAPSGHTGNAIWIGLIQKSSISVVELV